MKILIVDDEITARTILKNHLQQHVPGCELFEAANGTEAIFRYLKYQPDVVLLDLIMPVVDGEAFLNIIEDAFQKGFLKKEPKVVVITSFDDPGKLLEVSGRPSVETVIPKPITQATIERLKTLL